MVRELDCGVLNWGIVQCAVKVALLCYDELCKAIACPGRPVTSHKVNIKIANTEGKGGLYGPYGMICWTRLWKLFTYREAQI